MKLRQILILFGLVLFFASCTLFFATHSLRNHLYIATYYLFSYIKNVKIDPSVNGDSPFHNNTIWCDRMNYHSDICYMSGDIRTHSPSSSIILHPPHSEASNWVMKEERIRPYTRKWELPLMERIDEIYLRTGTRKGSFHHKCDVQHEVPALVFSAGGYTGNLFHAFNNGLLPLYITSQHLNRGVVFVVLKYRHWWYTKYEEILSQLSDYPIVDFSNDTRTHCFPAAIVGLRFHGTLSVDPRRILDQKNITDFRNLLAKAYKPSVKIKDNDVTKKNHTPKLVIISRKGTREIENENVVVQLGKNVGFDVEVLRPNETMPLKHIYEKLSTCDVAMGVHGAALTHFLFMQPGSTLIQIEPLGIEDQAWECFGEPALKMGIRYVNYKVNPRESSLYRNHRISTITNVVKMTEKKGWEHIKEVYLQGQNVTLDLNRVEKLLARTMRVSALRMEGKS